MPNKATSKQAKRTKQATTKPPVKIRRPRPGSKSEAILTLTTTTPATPTEIAESVDCDKSLVTRVLARYGIEKNDSESYKNHRAEIMAGIQEKILRKVNISEIKVSTPKELQSMLTGWGILYDKERLENDQSTSNVAVLVAGLKDLQAERWGKKVDT